MRKIDDRPTRTRNRVETGTSGGSTAQRNTAVPERSARGGIRTRTGLPPEDFKSQASTSFATRAGRPRNIPPAPAARLPMTHRTGELGRPADRHRAGITTALGRILGTLRAATGNARLPPRHRPRRPRAARARRRAPRRRSAGARRPDGHLGHGVPRRHPRAAGRRRLEPRARQRRSSPRSPTPTAGWARLTGVADIASTSVR